MSDHHHLPAMAQPPYQGGGVMLRQPGMLQNHYMPVRDDAEMIGEDHINIKAVIRTIMKHKWMVLGVTALCTLAATAYTLRVPPQYESVVRLQIDRQAQKVVGFNTDMEVDEGPAADQMQLRTQIELLGSRSLAERVIDELGLYKRTEDTTVLPNQVEHETPAVGGELPAGLATESPEEAPGMIEQFQSHMVQLFTPSVDDTKLLNREETVVEFQESVKIEPIRNSRLVEIKVLNSDATLSARIANTMAKSFIATALERKVDSSLYARQFLEEQIAQTKAKLEESERVINDYAKANQILNIDGKESAASRNFVDFSTALAKAEQDRIEAEALYNQVKTLPESAPRVLDNLAIQAYKEEKAKLEAEYAKNLAIYKPQFPSMVQAKAQIDRLDERIQAEINTILESIRGRYVAAKSQEALLRARVKASRDEVLTVQDRSVDLNLLQRELDTNRQVYDSLLQRLREVSVTAGITTNNVSIVDEAAVPLFPAKPRPILNLGLGIFAGLMLGALAAILREQLDDSIKHADEVEEVFGLPLLGWIPMTKPSKKLGNQAVGLLAHIDPRGAFSEAYRSMRTALQFSTAEGAPRRFMVTSCGKREGKSTTSLALAINFAQLGQKVLLIDADMRKSTVHKSLTLSNETGLSNFLTGDRPAEEFIQESSVPNLSAMTAGPTPPDPVELLMGPKLNKLLESAEKLGYTQIVIDGPPLLGIADAIVLGNQVQHVVFAVKASATKKDSIRDALRRLRTSGISPMGVVLTQARAEHTSNAAYETYYGYGEPMVAQAPVAHVSTGDTQTPLPKGATATS